MRTAVFFYDTRDEQVVRAIHNELRLKLVVAGLAPFAHFAGPAELKKFGFAANLSTHEKILLAVQHSDAVLWFCGPNGFGHYQSETEATYVVNHRATYAKLKVIPIILPGVQINKLLEQNPIGPIRSILDYQAINHGGNQVTARGLAEEIAALLDIQPRRIGWQIGFPPRRRAAGRLSDQLRERGLCIIVGPYAYGDTETPLPAKLAAMLDAANLGVPEEDLIRGELEAAVVPEAIDHLPWYDAASQIIRWMEPDDPGKTDRLVRGTVATRAAGSQVIDELVKFASGVARLPEARHLVIICTHFDTSVEDKLTEAGVPHTLLVPRSVSGSFSFESVQSASSAPETFQEQADDRATVGLTAPVNEIEPRRVVLVKFGGEPRAPRLTLTLDEVDAVTDAIARLPSHIRAVLTNSDVWLLGGGFITPPVRALRRALSLDSPRPKRMIRVQSNNFPDAFGADPYFMYEARLFFPPDEAGELSRDRIETLESRLNLQLRLESPAQYMRRMTEDLAL